MNFVFKVFSLKNQSKKHLTLLFSLVCASIFWGISCKNEERKASVSTNELPSVNVEFCRFDKALAAIDPKNAVAGVQQLDQKYPAFTRLYFAQLMPPRDPNAARALANALQKKGADSLTAGNFRPPHATELLAYPSFRRVLDTTQIVFKDFQTIENQLLESFKYWKYYFPKQEIKKVYTFVSEYSYATLLPNENNAVAIGLDLFLGAKHADYADPALQFPQYLRRTFTPEHIVVRTFEGLIADLPDALRGERFIDEAIRNGKKMYILEKLLPNVADSLIFTMTNDQIKWCKNSESAIWTFFTEQKLLYETERRKIRSYLETAPTSQGMPKESPGRTGNFIGYRIVSQFMEKHPNMSLEQLLILSDAQMILDKSKYKPAR
jgi:hypothetical protein